MLAGELGQTPGRGAVEGHANFLAALGVDWRTQGFGEHRRCLQRRQCSFPELLASNGRLLLQPAQIIAVLTRRRRLRLPGGVMLDHFGEQLRVAPAVHQNVVAGVDQVPVIDARLDQLQAEQRRAAQFKTLGALGVGQRIGVSRFKHFQRQCDLTDNRLVRGVEALPVEAAAQNVVTLQRGLPGLGEALRIEALNVQAQLTDVGAECGLMQGVKQHALLHRRQWVKVFKCRDVDRQHVELCLTEPRQREVRRRGLRCLNGAAMFDQRVEFQRVIVGQALDGRGVEHLTAEAPTQ
ncbi:hypothetical protein D3C87_1009320 [compost metagenome]